VSNFLAVATVTAALQEFLTPIIGADVNGSHVTTERPLTTTVTPAPSVNVYCYQVTPNPQWRNADLPTRGGGGQVVRTPVAALDLHYLFSFYGNDSELEPQRLLGSVARTLEAFPIVTRDTIAAVVAAAAASTNPLHQYLQDTDLGSQVESVRLTPQAFSLEELSRLWAVFPDVPYTLSMGYRASVVLIEQELPVVRPAPVLTRSLHVGIYRRPVVRSVANQAGPDLPIVATSTLAVRGTGLAPATGTVAVRLFGTDQAPSGVSDAELDLPLPSLPLLRAGLQPLQVVQELPLGTPAAPHPVVESNVAPFVLHPALTLASLLGPTTPTPGGGLSATVQTVLDLTVGAGQRVALLLSDGGGNLQRVIAAPDRPADASTLDVPVAGVPAGDYLVQVMVDGAESALVADPAHTVSFA
jgi:hypothetical protein